MAPMWLPARLRTQIAQFLSELVLTFRGTAQLPITVFQFGNLITLLNSRKDVKGSF